MRPLVLAPVAIALVGLAAGWFLPASLSPRRATQVLTGCIALVTAAVAAALVQVSVAGASEIPVVADAVGWCRALYAGHHGATPMVGALATSALAGATTGAVRHLRRRRSEMRSFAAVDGIEVVDAPGPVAFAVPGRPGGVVLGADLLQSLDPPGRAAVLAHENAHLRHHHHRYVGVADVCAAALPPLRPLADQVRFMTERWADEVAAEHIGSRQVLAETIARVALMAPSGPRVGLPFGGRRTLARVEALLEPPLRPATRAATCGVGVVLVVASGAGVQLHHLAEFFAHVCPI
jgi:hypothetical protein